MWVGLCGSQTVLTQMVFVWLAERRRLSLTDGLFIVLRDGFFTQFQQWGRERHKLFSHSPAPHQTFGWLSLSPKSLWIQTGQSKLIYLCSSVFSESWSANLCCVCVFILSQGHPGVGVRPSGPVPGEELRDHDLPLGGLYGGSAAVCWAQRRSGESKGHVIRSDLRLQLTGSNWGRWTRPVMVTWGQTYWQTEAVLQ